MKFKRPHKLNGHQYAAGDPFTGNVSVGRFLHQRGVLEPDGAPGDEAITAKSKPTAWNPEHAQAAEPETPTPEAPKRVRRRAPARRKE